jgi:pyruvate,orthophosphate dikinase
METAIFWARRNKQDLEIGVCGEQAGEPRSITYLHGIGVDYVSCSPFRIPIAKLVAAQAAVRQKTT